LPPSAIGVILAIGSLGAVGGALLVPRLEPCIGRTPLVIIAVGMSATSFFLIGCATGAPVAASTWLIITFALNGASQSMLNILIKTARQELVDPATLGRVMASFTLFSLGAIPLGALCGGILQAIIGMRATFLLAGLGSLLPISWIIRAFAPPRMADIAPRSRRDAGM
jgi:MFS family permease